MDNKVIGNKPTDNKQAGNKQKTMQSASAEGKISGTNPVKYFTPQNSPATTKASVDQKGDAGVKMAAGRAKKIIRQNTSYTDGAIARAKSMRGI